MYNTHILLNRTKVYDYNINLCNIYVVNLFKILQELELKYSKEISYHEFKIKKNDRNYKYAKSLVSDFSRIYPDSFQEELIVSGAS